MWQPAADAGVRRRWTSPPAVAAALITLALAGLLGVRTWERYQALQKIAAVPFDIDEAMNLAGRQVPNEVTSFYFFVLDTPTSLRRDAEELATKMQAAALEHDYLGITGPDPNRNLRTVLRALEAVRGKDLRGLVVIYLGPPDHRRHLSAPIAGSGARFLFVEFPRGASI
ncbi:MAG: hypothetical protein HYV18_04140 [Gammaproteobacteria bacterium]|nr:hypothetical protein [Gammaproteobacteria bacterium]